MGLMLDPIFRMQNIVHDLFLGLGYVVGDSLIALLSSWT